MNDSELLDWLDQNKKGYGNGWVCRDSTTGRGLRIHETKDWDTKQYIREAIKDFIENTNNKEKKISNSCI